MNYQFSPLTFLPWDEGDRSWGRPLPQPSTSHWSWEADPQKAELCRACSGLVPPRLHQQLYFCSSRHTRGKCAAEASFSAVFLEIINLCPSPSSLFLPHFFPPG